MTAGEAIDRARAMRPAASDEMSALYYGWLTEVEQEVIDHMNRHEDPNGGSAAEADFFDPLNLGPAQAQDSGDWQEQRTYAEGDEDRTLLLPVRFQMAYVYRLMCEIDQMVGETERYNNDATLYNATMTEWKAWYTRNNKPRNRKRAGWKLI